MKSGEVLGVSRPRSQKLVLALGAVALAAVVAIVLVVVLRGGSSYAWPAPVPVSAKTSFPAPPQGAVVFSRQLGSNALALGVVPRSGEVVLQASVLDGQGNGVPNLDMSLAVPGSSSTGAPCGPGCYRAHLPTAGRPASATVTIHGGPNAVQWRVALPTTWPPRDATALVLDAGRAWRSLQSLSFAETLASSPKPPVRSAWRIEAPDRVAYIVAGEGAGVVIGERRWDRAPGSTKWVESAQTRLTQPLPAWGLVTDAYVLGTTVVRGRPAWRISFFDPATPGWFEVTLDRSTMHTLDTQMVATAHFMHDVYGAFDTTPKIVPPK